MTALGLQFRFSMTQTAMRPQRPQTPRPATEDLGALAQAAGRGDRAAFDRLHDRLAGGLKRILLNRTGGRADLADELAQRTWVILWDAISGGKYDPARSAITTFLYAISHKVWLQHLRTSSRRAVAPADAAAGVAAGIVDAGDAAGLAEVLSAVRECMEGGEDGVPGALNPEERALIRAVAAGHSDRSLARLLGLAPSTVNVRKRTVFEKVRRFLAIRGHRGPERPAGESE